MCALASLSPLSPLSPCQGGMKIPSRVFCFSYDPSRVPQGGLISYTNACHPTLGPEFCGSYTNWSAAGAWNKGGCNHIQVHVSYQYDLQSPMSWHALSHQQQIFSMEIFMHAAKRFVNLDNNSNPTISLNNIWNASIVFFHEYDFSLKQNLVIRQANFAHPNFWF